MMSLFASFDLRLFPLAMSLYLLMSLNIFSSSHKINTFLQSLLLGLKALLSFFYSLKPLMIGKFFLLYSLSVLIIIFIFNFTSVLPFSFPACSQVSLVLFMGLCSWLAIVSCNVFSNVKGILSHCIPEGTPIYLTWFLFLIEIVSNVIRPLTLTVRLTANILAGHLLMILLSNLALYSFAVSSLYLLLNVVEMFVALIQSYIFVTMVSLYHSDLA
uniref:ATP synthase subunit a n=1 Tax=Phyllocoptes taishanensis TaxID=1638174 RepID=A0A0U2ND61_9ACAR|nr:ATP synthase F0 subunit 6 [Phyllocoptes taishanensis]ALK03799.1 ATP synthase subunit 6 [Phyllocoptes taishanensis]